MKVNHKYLGLGLMGIGLTGLSGYGVTLGSGAERRITKEIEKLIKERKWKSVKIKWDKDKGSDGWDFALMKSQGNPETLCRTEKFTVTVSSEWTKAYRNLGWNVNKKSGGGDDNKKICIWKIK